jgi:DNA primase
MAGRIRQEDVDAVRERTDLVKVISGHLQLKKSGRDSVVGLCPFHTEKTPSLSVSPSKQLYYCFGCAEGGNVFDFLRKLEGLSFVEAVEKLAAEAGVTLRYEGDSPADRRAVGRRQALHRAIAQAASLYNRTLLEGREGSDARAYLESRVISRASIERFQVGYAPTYQDFLLRRLAKDFSAELLVEAGLVTKDPAGALRDRFRGRVMFPIHDVSGNAVGFGGRLLESAGTNAQQAAKYVNSADSPIYHKGSLLYNLSRVKGDITRAGRAFVVEGYTDVIGLDQGGIPLAVATCGTALGEDHIRLLSRFTDRIVLAFDSDEAGARAAERAYQFHERYAVDLSVLVLPQGQDPADFVLAQGGEAFATLAERAVPLVGYMIGRTLIGRNLADLEERARAVQAGLGIVAGLDDPVRQREYAGVLADRVGVNVNEVLLDLDRLSRPDAANTGREAHPHVTRVPKHQRVEREALKLMVQAPELCAETAADLRGEHFATPAYRKMFELIREAEAGPAAPGQESRGPRSSADLVARAQQDRGEQTGKLLAALAVEPLETEAGIAPDYPRQVFLRLDELVLKRKADEIRKLLQKVNPVKEPDQHRAMFEELIRLDAAARRARQAAEETASLL